MGRLTDVVKNLIIINVIVFIGTIGLPDYYREMAALHSPFSDDFRPYQLVTSMLMHQDLFHLFMNMLTLFFLGPMVEQVLGVKRFFIIYFISAFGAILLSVGINFILFRYFAIGVDPSIVTAIIEGKPVYENQVNSDNISQVQNMLGIVGSRMWGASGATYGIIAAFGTLFPNLKVMLLIPPIPMKAKYIALAIIGIAVFSGFFGINSSVAHWAHVGGALLGFIMIRFIWKLQSLR